jgi:predicted permease
MSWLKQIFSRGRLYNDLSDELQQHLEEKVEELVAAGMPRNEAIASAHCEFGNVTLIEEDSREVWQWPSLESFFADVRYALRILRKNPGFTFIAVLTLALGIGANTAIFSIVNAVILRPLPYKDSSRILTLHTKTAMFPNFTLGLSWPAFQAIRAAGALEEAAACWETDRTLTGTNQPAVLGVAGVSSGFFEELGGRAEQGRLLSDQDQKAAEDRVAVISNTFWRTRFAQDPAMIGRRLILDNKVYTVVGVAAKGFAYPERADAWVPISLTSDIEQNPTFFTFDVLAKLRKKARLETLRAELATIAPRLEQQLAKNKPDLAGDYKITAETLLDNRVQDARQSYLVLLAAATLVLLIACANLTSLLLARGWARHREMAMRAALGASPGRLRRQVLVESCLLAVLGGLAGMGLAVGAVQIFCAIAPPDTARLEEVSLDWTLLWFALASSLLSGLIVGLAPARRAARMSPNELFKQGTGAGAARRPSRFGSALVVVEVALAFILLAGSTLMVQTLAHLLYQNPGFRTDHLLTLDLPQPPNWDEKDADRHAASQIARMKQIMAEVRRLPGVQDLAASDHGVLNGLEFSHAGIKLEGISSEKAEVSEGIVSRYLSPGYFRMLGISLLRGREFEEHDARQSNKVALVDEAMARKFWGTLDVVGKRISISKDDKGNPEWNEIVGVVSNVRDLDIQQEAQPEYFLALFQWGVGSHHLVVRTRTNPDALADTISRQIWASFPDQPLTHVMTLTRTIADSVGDQRLHTALLGIFAAVGLAVALLGVYGVVSYSVARRTQEIGVRMALGAARADILRMVLRQGLTLVAWGAAIGTAGALGATRAIASELYGVTPTDPATFAAAIALMLSVGCLACWIPARRAVRVDPLIALRYE